MIAVMVVAGYPIARSAFAALPGRPARWWTGELYLWAAGG